MLATGEEAQDDILFIRDNHNIERNQTEGMIAFKRLQLGEGSIPVVEGVPEVCAGCPAQAEVNQEIVDFAVSQLQGSDGMCSRTDVEVENFQSQV